MIVLKREAHHMITSFTNLRLHLQRFTEKQMLTKWYFYNTELAQLRNNPIHQVCGDSIPIREDGINVSALMDEIDSETMHAKYLISALRTWNIKYCPEEQIANACLGIVSEIVELFYDDKPESELGDLLYYRIILRYLMGDSLEFESTHSGTLRDAFSNASMFIADVGKKVAYHDKFLAEQTRTRYRTGMQAVDTIIVYFLHKLGTPLHEIYNQNIAKLAARHSNGKFNPGYTK